MDIEINEIFVNGQRFVREGAPQPDPTPTPDPDPNPTPNPPPKPSIKKLGFNTNDSRYYQSVCQFTNIAQTPSFYTHETPSWDEFGYPTRGKSDLKINVWGGRKVKVGTYIVKHSGSGKVDKPSFTISEGQDQVLLKFNGEVGPDLTIRHEDDEEFYTNTFSERASKAACIRYMDPWWTNITNGYDHSTPFVRKFGNNVNFAHSLMTPEIISDISLKFNTNAWICVHHLWDLALVRKIAKRFAAKLSGTNIKLYVESSNEVWNGAFPQGNFAKKEENGGYARYHADRTVDVVSIFKEELPGQVFGVVGYQLDSPGLLDGGFREGKKDLSIVDYVAINPYIGGKWTRDQGVNILNLDFNKIHEAVLADFNARVKERSLAWKAKAASYGMGVIAYESGLHTAPLTPLKKNEGLMKKLHQYTMSEEAGEVCGQLYDFFSGISYLNMAYMDVSSGDGIIFGNREFERDLNSPRWRAWLNRA